MAGRRALASHSRSDVLSRHLQFGKPPPHPYRVDVSGYSHRSSVDDIEHLRRSHEQTTQHGDIDSAAEISTARQYLMCQVCVTISSEYRHININLNGSASRELPREDRCCHRLVKGTRPRNCAAARVAW